MVVVVLAETVTVAVDVATTTARVGIVVVMDETPLIFAVEVIVTHGCGVSIQEQSVLTKLAAWAASEENRVAFASTADVLECVVVLCEVVVVVGELVLADESVVLVEDVVELVVVIGAALKFLFCRSLTGAGSWRRKRSRGVGLGIVVCK